MLENIILGIIFENDLTGYDIKKYIENNIGIYYKASCGSLYPALKKISSKGFVTFYEELQGKRKKIFYHITESGKDKFLEWLTEPMDVLDGTNPNLTKIYFFHHLPIEKRKELLLDFESKNEQYLSDLMTIEAKLQTLELNNLSYYTLSTLYYGISVTKKTLEWCRHIREDKPLKDFK